MKTRTSANSFRTTSASRVSASGSSWTPSIRVGGRALALDDQGDVLAVEPHKLREAVFGGHGPRRRRGAPVGRRRWVRLGPDRGAGDWQARIPFHRMERHGGAPHEPQRLKPRHAGPDVLLEEIARRPALRGDPVVRAASRPTPTQDVSVHDGGFQKVKRSRRSFKPPFDHRSSTQTLIGRQNKRQSEVSQRMGGQTDDPNGWRLAVDGA